MKNPSATVQPAAASRLSLRVLILPRKAWLQLQRWWELAEQRRRLAMLDAHALHDLGLSRADAVRESERPFWDDPLAPATRPRAQLRPAGEPDRGGLPS